MIEAQLAKQWAAMPDFPNRLASWTWFKNAVSECLALTALRLHFRCELRNGDLAAAFFEWAGYMDSNQNYLKIDAVDFAHYCSGVMLRSFIRTHPISVIERQDANSADKTLLDQMNWPEDLVLLCLTLTFLESWRLHLGAQPLALDLDLIKGHWDSFHENAREDSFSCVAFLDLFLGLQPAWENPITVGNRPAMHLAVSKLHPLHS